jgi:hypothetical protein
MKNLMASPWAFWLVVVLLVVTAFLSEYNKVAMSITAIVASGIVLYWGINSLISAIKEIKNLKKDIKELKNEL